MSFTFPTISALGTSWWIEIFDDISSERYTVIHDDCVAFLRTFENRYSRFKPDSLIGRLNADGYLDTPDAEFFTLLSFGVAQFARTDGVFNIMVGGTLVETGYDANYSFAPQNKRSPIPSPEDVLNLTPERITLTNGLLDFGGFGKGYAIDAIATILRTHGLTYFLVNGGGDMYGTSDHGKPITVYLEHPTEPDTYLETTTIMNQGFAASSPHKRAWKHDGEAYTHIINTNNSPHTERPDATFIKATTAVDADIFATVALLVPSNYMTLLAAREQLGVASFYLEDSSLTRNQAFEHLLPS